jgi:hypothetical protein
MSANFGDPDNDPIRRGEFDYIKIPVYYNIESTMPNSFGGMSGGGIWQIEVTEDQPSVMTYGELLLSGVVFYEDDLVNDCRNVIGHGRHSVYEIAYKSIMK